MATALQGFSLNKNLEESTQDRNTINNLAGSPFGDDISLFFNNRRNTSTLTVVDANRRDPQGSLWSKITLPTAAAVFSNNTKLTINGDVYYVKNSNGTSQFELSLREDLATTVSEPPIGNYVRSDEVTSDNIVNYSSPLDKRFNNISFSATAASSTYNPTKFLYINTFGTSQSLLSSIISEVDTYNFRIGKTLKITENFNASAVLNINGAVVVKDPNGFNNTGLTNPDGSVTNKPGVYILNAATGGLVRAFSSNDNPWLAAPSATVGNPVPLQYIEGGSGYVNGTYNGLTLQPVIGSASVNPTANIVVSGGIVTQVNLTSQGSGYTPFSLFTTAGGALGGSGSGFSVPVGLNLTTTQPNINIGSLILSNTVRGVDIRLKASSMVQTVSGSIGEANDTDFTHKLPVTVNGEQFFLCLKLL